MSAPEENDQKPEGGLSGKLEELILARKKIEAIKYVREETGYDLKKAKDHVDAIECKLAETHPELKQKGGCAAVLIITLLLTGTFSLIFKP